ncbi:MAG: hypothetical protein EXR79_07720 [Myxococcales bacterium]|nr:hypothetical protein [Myxococcales bacterium]
MSLIDAIVDFFMRLVRGRIDSVHIQAKSKMMGLEHRAKSAASKRFNSAVDGTIGKAAGAVGRDPKHPQPAAQAAKPKT